MIINIRGTHGSGKSTIVRKLMERLEDVRLYRNNGKVLGSAGQLRDGSTLSVVGDYANACGGCDGIQPYSLIWPRVLEFSQWGHVIFEGALVSSSYGNIGRDSAVFGDQFVFGFLDTPLNVCLERIVARRKARGNDKPLDPKNTENKYNSILKSIPKIRDEFHRRVVILDYRYAVSQILGLLYEERV